jgi:hypothetical protein
MATNQDTKTPAISDEMRQRRRAMRKALKSHGLIFRKITAKDDPDAGKYRILDRVTDQQVPATIAMTIAQAETWLKKYEKEQAKDAPDDAENA